jgi:signal transduction histidine kinase
MFEPFFTTKGVGEGTGLGLDTVQRIVKKHRGSIHVNSKSGDTRFQVWLSLSDARV